MMKLKENKVMTIDLDGPNGNAFYLLGYCTTTRKTMWVG